MYLYYEWGKPQYGSSLFLTSSSVAPSPASYQAKVMSYCRTPFQHVKNPLKRHFHDLGTPRTRKIIHRQDKLALGPVFRRMFSVISATKHSQRPVYTMTSRHLPSFADSGTKSLRITGGHGASLESGLTSTSQPYIQRLKFSHPYPLDVATHPISPAWLGGPNFLPKDLKCAIDAIVGEGVHCRRWAVLNVISPSDRSSSTQTPKTYPPSGNIRRNQS